jgi:hypothetical protein
MAQKLSHYRSDIPVDADGVLEYLLVGIGFRAM